LWVRAPPDAVSNFPRRRIKTGVTVGFDGVAVRKAYYFKTKNSAREFQSQIKRWKVNQKTPGTTLEISEIDKRWVAYLRAHVASLDQLPEIVAHWARTAKQIKQSNRITPDEELEELGKRSLEYYQFDDEQFPTPMSAEAFYGIAGEIYKLKRKPCFIAVAIAYLLLSARPLALRIQSRQLGRSRRLTLSKSSVPGIVFRAKPGTQKTLKSRLEIQ
jgi:hypothetical protein